MEPARGMAPTRSYPWAQVSLSAKIPRLQGRAQSTLLWWQRHLVILRGIREANGPEHSSVRLSPESSLAVNEIGVSPWCGPSVSRALLQVGRRGSL